MGILKNIKPFLKDLSLRVAGALAGIVLIFGLFFIGDSLGISFLQSKGGLFISTIIVGEVLFFLVLIFAVLHGDM